MNCTCGVIWSDALQITELGHQQLEDHGFPKSWVSLLHRLWMQKQEVAFTAWLNRVLMPVHATANAREAAGMSGSTLVRPSLKESPAGSHATGCFSMIKSTVF